jgi:hypothetical protein
MVGKTFMKLIHAFAAGLAGAVTLTIAHQLLRKISSDAPRMDLMGEEALEKISDKADIHIPEKKKYGVTMAGDILGNTLYYSLAAIRNNKSTTARGGLLGLAAGIGGIFLPSKLGLTNSYSNRNVKTSLMTMAIYSLGGLVAAEVASALAKNDEQRLQVFKN